MLSARLDEIAQRAECAVSRARRPTAASSCAPKRRRRWTRWSRTAASNAAWRRSSPRSTASARFGFTATELNREKLNLQRVSRAAVVEKDKSPSGPLADEFVRNFIHAEPIPGIVYEFGLNQRFLPEITLAEVNALAKDWVPDRNRLVVVSAPEKDRATLPDRGEAGGGHHGGRAATADGLRRYASARSRCSRVCRRRERSPATSTNDALGITEWRLSNGVRVVLKPTTFKQDEILFRAVSPGGTSLASDEDFIASTTLKLYSAKLINEEAITQQQVDVERQRYRELLDKGSEIVVRSKERGKYAVNWKPYFDKDWREPVKSSISLIS